MISGKGSIAFQWSELDLSSNAPTGPAVVDSGICRSLQAELCTGTWLTQKQPKNGDYRPDYRSQSNFQTAYAA